MQGDLLTDIEVPTVIFSDTSSHQGVEESAKLLWQGGSYIVLTQSCDLDPNNSKDIRQVVLAPVATVSEFVRDNPTYKNTSKITGVIKNREMGLYTMHPPLDSIYGEELLIASLYHTSLIDLDALMAYIKDRGYTRRYHLSSPYVESLSQAYGNLFSRVAIPGKFPQEAQVTSSIVAAQSITVSP